MKLLPKIHIQSQVAAQKKAQIDEGVRIASKVDALRQTLADLEKQHATYIDGMEAELKHRTGHLIQKVAELESEIKILEEKRTELRAPLDAEWEEVKKAKADVEKIKLLLTDRLQILNKKIDAQAKRDKKSRDLAVITRARDTESIKEAERVEELKTEAQTINNESVAKAEARKVVLDNREYVLNNREKSLDNREFYLDQRQAKMEATEAENVAETIRLADQRATLERAFARLNKK